MPLIDDRGRLFGTLNLIDAGIMLFLLLLLPVGFVAYRVFRIPDPVIDRVTPAVQPPGSDRRLTVTGRDFRPYLRVFVIRTGQPFALVGGNSSFSEGHFLVETPAMIEIKLPDDLAPASYDLHFFDEGQQVAERLRAFTISEAPRETINVVVHFVAPSEVASLMHAGDTDSRAGGETTASWASATVKSATRVGSRTTASATPVLSGIGVAYLLQQPAEIVEAVLTMPVTKTETGAWEYKHQTIRPGDVVRFETARYAMQGMVQRMATQ